MIRNPDSSRLSGSATSRPFTWVDHSGITSVATHHQVDQLDRDGFFVLERPFHSDTIDDVIAAVSLESGVAGQPMSWSRSDESPGEVLRRFCSHPLLAGLARDFVGPDACVHSDTPIVHLPHTPTPQTYWQDAVAGSSGPAQSLTCWVALTDNTAAGGCLQVVRGRHRQGVLTIDLTGPAGQIDIDPRSVIDVEAPAGSVVVMSSLTPRRLRANFSDQPGLAYAIHYVPDNIVDLGSESDIAVPTRRQLPVVRGGQLVGPS